ncbi:MAG: cell division protein FtsL [Alkalilacustris sp.]
MRGIFYILTVLALIGLASWAYHETHRTQAAMAEMRQLQREIGSLREALSVQRAEWAWLNRPDRLRLLAEANFDRLRLMPMRPTQFGEIEQIAFPPPPPNPLLMLPEDMLLHAPAQGEEEPL